jgi:YidC/Oxa1 family membrane protein insertase
MTRRKWPECIRAVQREFVGEPRLSLETGVASFESLRSADVMISDFSGAALEFALGFERPVVFVDVPRKVNNPEYERIGVEPLEVTIREKIGRVVAPDRLSDLPGTIRELAGGGEETRKRIASSRNETVFNVGESGRVGAQAIATLADECSDRGASSR